MADPKTEPTTDMAAADAANGEPGALEDPKRNVERASAHDEAGDDAAHDHEVEHPTGGTQAQKNREDESPA